MEIQPKEIRRYVRFDGKIPFDQWFNRLRDRQAQYRIDFRKCLTVYHTNPF
ncbi:hypothetical protein PL9631_1060174 [Planktothrix paucivesiculata PCC 9631]|uniref:Uncharacterized protein n=1 Tax=Planktothrix paucivesiculata PCC 9631 TaxID=671071 RepID=A0A7Z9DV72_9CYAN|nr:hypothetical protein PL9631_1060174 [Planktothrix paucivesiculata PCC 9631]